MLISLSLLWHSSGSLPREQCLSQWAAWLSSPKLTKAIFHRHSPRPISQGSLYFKLTIDSNHHIWMEMLIVLFGDGLSIFVTENMFVLYRFTLLESFYSKMVINLSYIIVCSYQSPRRCAKLVKKKKQLYLIPGWRKEASQRWMFCELTWFQGSCVHKAQGRQRPPTILGFILSSWLSVKRGRCWGR